MTVQDKIEREMILPVSRERVWAALTSPKGLMQWFGTIVEMDKLAAGEPILFGWSDDEQHRGRIETVDPMQHFAYRWNATETDMVTPFEDMPSTLVSFWLEDAPEGTHLKLVESGFASLPEHLRIPHHQENSSGWDSELAELREYLQQPEAQ